VLFPDGTPDPTDYNAELLSQIRPSPAQHNPACALLLQLDPQHLTKQELSWQCLCSMQNLTDDHFDGLARAPEQLLAGSNGVLTDVCDMPPETSQAAEAWRQGRLEQAARQWVQAAAHHLPTTPTPPLEGRSTGAADVFGVRHTVQLNTTANAAYWTASGAGIVLLEPFGGLCAGLEMALRSGTVIKQYLYLDSSPTARAIAAHRVIQLQSQYPAQLSYEAVQGMFALPQDITAVSCQQLVALGATQQQHPWLVVAGWPCQELLSAAGTGLGLQGPRSGLLHELVRIVGALGNSCNQSLRPPTYWKMLPSSITQTRESLSVTLG
jgi:hypothetical protein